MEMEMNEEKKGMDIIKREWKNIIDAVYVHPLYLSLSLSLFCLHTVILIVFVIPNEQILALHDYLNKRYVISLSVSLFFFLFLFGSLYCII